MLPHLLQLLLVFSSRKPGFPTSNIWSRASTTSLYAKLSFPRTATISSTPLFMVSRTVSFSFTCPILPTVLSLLRFCIPTEACSSGGFSTSSPCVCTNHIVWHKTPPKQMTADQLHAIPLLKIFAIPAWAVYETKSCNIMLHVSTHGTDNRVKTLHECN